MREVKYRGRQVTTREWVYGVPVKEIRTGAVYMVEGYDGVNGDMIREIVDPETVGQYVRAITVSTIPEPVELWEGDRVIMYWQHDSMTNYDYKIEGIVQYDETIGKWEVVSKSPYEDMNLYHQLYNYERDELCDIEVITDQK